MVCRAGTKELYLLQSAVAPISAPSTFHSSCNYWQFSLAGCHSFLPQYSGEHLRSHKHNLVHSRFLPSLSLPPHMSVINFIFGWHPCQSPVLCSAFGFPLGMKPLRQQFCSSLFPILQPTSSVYCLERRTALTACNGIPKYLCGDSETACTVSVVKGQPLYRNVNML